MRPGEQYVMIHLQLWMPMWSVVSSATPDTVSYTPHYSTLCWGLHGNLIFMVKQYIAHFSGLFYKLLATVISVVFC